MGVAHGGRAALSEIPGAAVDLQETPAWADLTQYAVSSPAIGSCRIFSSSAESPHRAAPDMPHGQRHPRSGRRRSRWPAHAGLFPEAGPADVPFRHPAHGE